VTPSSQIVGTQAVFNVLMGPYKVITAEFADLMLGYYGSTLGERDPEVMARCEKQTKKVPIMMRPADLLKPEWEQLRMSAIALDGCDGSDEDILTTAMFPKVAPKFFSERGQGPKSVAKDPSAATAAVAPSASNGAGPVRETIKYEVHLDGKKHVVTVSPAKA
jgi:methylmalonyl-CoA carboxyltransferase 5S subunit